MPKPLQCPFPWFGGKSRVAHQVWARLGFVGHYVEPFAGSLAVLLGRPHPEPGLETVNDRDGFVCNFWRALQTAPDRTAQYADWPVNENDLHARHAWLTPRRARLTARLEGDPAYCDARIAGWWAWGLACWIGGAWCQAGSGPWVRRKDAEGVWQLVRREGSVGGVARKRPGLGDAGRRLISSGTKRQRPQLATSGMALITTTNGNLVPWFRALQNRLRRVRVCCGDWARVVQPAVLGATSGPVGVFLDPPYDPEVLGLPDGLYAEDQVGLSARVGQWCRENGENRRLRIVLCGYAGEHVLPGWSQIAWHGSGYGAGKTERGDKNRKSERIWFSPGCQAVTLV